MSALTDYLELQRNQMAADSRMLSGSQPDSLPGFDPPARNAMNKLVMNYLVTGKNLD